MDYNIKNNISNQIKIIKETQDRNEARINHLIHELEERRNGQQKIRNNMINIKLDINNLEEKLEEILEVKKQFN